MSQAVDCELFLCADDSCLVYQHKDVKAIDTKLKCLSFQMFAIGLSITNSAFILGKTTKCIFFGIKKET